MRVFWGPAPRLSRDLERVQQQAKDLEHLRVKEFYHYVRFQINLIIVLSLFFCGFPNCPIYIDTQSEIFWQ